MKYRGKEMGDYIEAETTDTSDDQSVQKAVSINGGFFPLNPQASDKYPSIVIGVENVEDAMKEIVQAGGTLIGEVMDVPNIGKFISFTVTEGNRANVLEAHS